MEQKRASAISYQGAFPLLLAPLCWQEDALMGGGESLRLAEMHCTAFLREDGGAGPTWRDRAAQLQDVITFL